VDQCLFQRAARLRRNSKAQPVLRAEQRRQTACRGQLSGGRGVGGAQPQTLAVRLLQNQPAKTIQRLPDL